MPHLPAGTHLVDDGAIIVHVGEDGTVRAAPNRCAHQSSRLGAPEGCILTCGLHGWQLDASTMRYLAPQADATHPEYAVEKGPEEWQFFEPTPPRPWDARQPRRGLIPGSFTVTLGEDVQIRAGGGRLAFRPAAAPPGQPEVWRTVSNAGRAMWLKADDDRWALLVEVAGHRLLVADRALATPPTPVDLLALLDPAANALAVTASPTAVLAADAASLRPTLRGTPIWEGGPERPFDVTTGRPVVH